MLLNIFTVVLVGLMAILTPLSLLLTIKSDSVDRALKNHVFATDSETYRANHVGTLARLTIITSCLSIGMILINLEIIQFVIK